VPLIRSRAKPTPEADVQPGITEPQVAPGSYERYGFSVQDFYGSRLNTIAPDEADFGALPLTISITSLPLSSTVTK
jgi:hypothetical protein